MGILLVFSATILISWLSYKTSSLYQAEVRLRQKQRHDSQIRSRRKHHNAIANTVSNITNDEYLFEYVSSLLQSHSKLTRSPVAYTHHLQPTYQQTPKAFPCSPITEVSKKAKPPSADSLVYDDGIPILAVAS